jgi:hypothetical protein
MSEESTELVLCSHFNALKCPRSCEHSRPHSPIHDHYDTGKGPCDELFGKCGFRSDQPYCKCKGMIHG